MKNGPFERTVEDESKLRSLIFTNFLLLALQNKDSFKN